MKISIEEKGIKSSYTGAVKMVEISEFKGTKQELLNILESYNDTTEIEINPRIEIRESDNTASVPYCPPSTQPYPWDITCCGSFNGRNVPVSGNPHGH